MQSNSRDSHMRTLLRRAEKVELSLGALDAITQIRKHLDALEVQAFEIAREKGATAEDLAEALDVTPQTIYYRLKNGTRRRGRPRAANEADSLEV
jgi:hypothetical protein